ncbi:hypothetical protein [Pseudomonas palleroniana]
MAPQQLRRRTRPNLRPVALRRRHCSATRQALSSGQPHMAGATEHLIDNAKTLADSALECLHAA